jgi:hypothetical protein
VPGGMARIVIEGRKEIQAAAILKINACFASLYDGRTKAARPCHQEISNLPKNTYLNSPQIIMSHLGASAGTTNSGLIF